MAVVCPRRAIISRTVAPLAAAYVAPEPRRSWKCSPLTLALAQAAAHRGLEPLAAKWPVVQVSEGESIRAGADVVGQVLLDRPDHLGRYGDDATAGGRLGRPEHLAPARQLDCGFLDSATWAPCSSRRRTQMRREVWRCLGGAERSAANTSSIQGFHGPSTLHERTGALRAGGTAEAKAWRTARRCTLYLLARALMDWPWSRLSLRIFSNSSTLDTSFLPSLIWSGNHST